MIFFNTKQPTEVTKVRDQRLAMLPLAILFCCAKISFRAKNNNAHQLTKYKLYLSQYYNMTRQSDI